MRLENYLNELFDTKVPVTVTHQSAESYETQFEVEAEITGEDKKYEFYAEFNDASLEWEVEFARMVEKGTGYEKMDDMTAKETLSVFSGVKTSMEKFLKKYDPTFFNFSGKVIKGKKAKSRVKLYDKFAGVIAKKHGYVLKKKTTAQNTKYIFTKIRPEDSKIITKDGKPFVGG